MERSRIGLVIPALNEARSIGAVVRGAREYGVPIVVDDGSTDATSVVARQAGAEVVTLAANRGYDGALNAGFERAAALDMLCAITLDADGQHNPATLAGFIAALDQGAEVVIGVRDRRQRITEHLFAWWARHRWGVLDPLCGMKGYRLETYREHGAFDTCRSIGTELAICSVARGRRIVQLPVPTRDRDGKPRFGSTLRANWRIARALVLVRSLASRAARSHGASRR